MFSYINVIFVNSECCFPAATIVLFLNPPFAVWFHGMSSLPQDGFQKATTDRIKPT